MEDVILLVILVSVLYLLLCLLIAFIRALFPGKRSRKSCFKDTFWMFFLEHPESPQLALTDAGQKVALFLKRTISRNRITAKNRPGHLTGAVWLPYSAS